MVARCSNEWDEAGGSPPRRSHCRCVRATLAHADAEAWEDALDALGRAGAGGSDDGRAAPGPRLERKLERAAVVPLEIAALGADTAALAARRGRTLRRCVSRRCRRSSSARGRRCTRRRAPRRGQPRRPGRRCAAGRGTTERASRRRSRGTPAGGDPVSTLDPALTDAELVQRCRAGDRRRLEHARRTLLAATSTRSA